MRYERPIGGALAGAVVASILAWATPSFAQTNADPNAAPNSYQLDAGWLKMPEGRQMGQAISVDIDRDGKSVWVFDRCGGGDCANSMLNPIEKDVLKYLIRGNLMAK